MRALALVIPILLVGCATRPAPVNQPLVPINVDCRYGPSLSEELEGIIKAPQVMSPRWNITFGKIAGYSTSEQRRQSAKSVLWTIRSRCPSY